MEVEPRTRLAPWSDAARTVVGKSWAVVLLIAIVVALAYGQILNNGLAEYDDPTLLYCVSHGIPASPHFRPLYDVWNALLFRAFGLVIWPYYAAGLLLHAGGACAAAQLVRRLTSSSVAGLVAGLVFAVLYSPHQAVVWIAANCGLLSVAFVWLAALAWHAHVSSGSRRAYYLALLAIVGAMCSKEDCVVLAPLLFGIDLCVNGSQVLRVRTLVRRYSLLVFLAAMYLVIAYRPGLWADRPDIGLYSFRGQLVFDLLGNFALLFAIGDRHPAASSLSMVLVGASIVVLLVVCAIRMRGNGPVMLTGLAVALVGLCPTLPGPFEVAGTRYAYASAIGVALIAGGLAASMTSWIERSRWGFALRMVSALALASWVGLDIAAIRSIEQWRYERSCSRFRNMIESTRTAVDSLRNDPASARSLAVIAPDISNPVNYQCGLRLYLGDVAETAEVQWIPVDAASSEWIAPGHGLDPARSALYTTNAEGRLQRIDPLELATTLEWLAKRSYSGAHTSQLPVVWLTLLQVAHGD